MAKTLWGILPDVLTVAGTGLLAVGLWIVAPWLSFVVLGILLLVSGILLGRQH